PVDYLVHSYNVRRILHGDPAPIVQISVHPMDAGGVLALPPLLQSENVIIRTGIAALFAERLAQLEQSPQDHWSQFQIADHLLREKLRSTSQGWQPLSSPDARPHALDRFHKYAYQWY